MEMDFTKLSIGEQLRMKRLSQRKSQSDIAKELGINRTYISFYELGRLTVTAEHKEKLNSYINA